MIFSHFEHLKQLLRSHYQYIGMMDYLFYALLLAAVVKCNGEDGGPFQRIDRKQTFCELNSMTAATKLSDHYNSLDEHTRKSERLQLDYIAEHLGFGWEHELRGLSQANSQQEEVTASAEGIALQKKGGWVIEGGIAPAYKFLENKWIYFYGDHTLRHVAHSFLIPAHGKSSFHRAECALQLSRKKHGEEIPVAMGAAPEPAAHSDTYLPQHSKAKTCQFPGFGANGKITYDWKHAPYDEYDKWLFGETGLWNSEATASQVPDILIVQLGYSTCLPSADPTLEKSDLQHGEATFEEHQSQADELFKAIKIAISRPEGASSGKQTTVIISTAPRSRIRNPRAEFCTYKMNRIVALAAHKQGFAVFEREEMEHRINFKSETSDDIQPLGVLDDAPPPTVQILSTSLISMLTCLASNVIEPASV